MRIRNDTDGLLTSWTGHDIQPGQTQDLDLPAAEAEWLLRHGCSEVGAEKIVTDDSEPMPSAANSDPTSDFPTSPA